MITCRELVAFLMSYLDGELPPTSHAAFEEHLKRCPACRQYLETYKQTVRLGKEAFEAAPACPGPVPEELVQAILEAKRRDAARLNPPSEG